MRERGNLTITGRGLAENASHADSGRIGGFMEQAVELAGRHRLTGPLTGKQPASAGMTPVDSG
jgi:hypothetical protein